MVRTKLIEIEKEIEKYLGIPYAKNIWKNLNLQKEAVFGGKGTWQEIEYATKCAAEKKNLNIDKLNSKQIYNLQKRNRIGIDCSGLVYHLLEKLDQLNNGRGILFKITGVDKPFGVIGVRTVSASELTHLKNSTKITDISKIQLGDLIRLDSGKHVAMIVKTEKQNIYYIHSSNRTKKRGVHYGIIEIINPKKNLDQQLWQETTIDGQNYKVLFNPKKGDGIFRPKIF
jgi:hypothetical protein